MSLSILRRVKKISCCGLVASCLATGVGCDSATSTIAAQNQTELSTVASSTESSQMSSPASFRQSLVGTWVGRTVIDEEMLELRLTQMTPEQQEAAVLQAESLLSTLMAIEYNADGTVEAAVEITPLGEQTVKDMSTGQWRVADVEEDRVMVETNEVDSDGTSSLSKKVYRFYPDRNAFAMTVPTSTLLKGCDVLMIFERQPLAAINMAETPSQNMQK